MVSKKDTPGSPIKWHGGKAFLASRFVALMPQHVHYCEPYFGGGSVLFAKDPEGVSEVVNDLDGDLTNFWTTLQYPPLFEEFNRRLSCVPFSEMEYADAAGYLENHPRVAGKVPDLNRAVAFFVCCRQSLAGRMDHFAPLSKTRVRRGMNEQAAAWLTAVGWLPAVHERLKRVVVLNRDALDVIRQQDGPDTLFYLDPPYLPSTRASTGEYAHEMTEEQHAKLLTVLGLNVTGKFILSGYRSGLYDEAARTYRWHRRDFDLPNNASGGKTKRRMVESVWCNFEPPPGAGTGTESS